MGFSWRGLKFEAQFFLFLPLWDGKKGLEIEISGEKTQLI